MPDSTQRQMKAWVIGLDMFYATAGMLLIGALIDHFAGTRPWWMLGLGVVGLLVGMIRFIVDAARLNREQSPTGGDEGPPRAGALSAGSEGSDGPCIEVPGPSGQGVSGRSPVDGPFAQPPSSSPGGQNPAKP